jgi:phage FluMu protein Com
MKTIKCAGCGKIIAEVVKGRVRTGVEVYCGECAGFADAPKCDSVCNENAVLDQLKNIFSGGKNGR